MEKEINIEKDPKAYMAVTFDTKSFHKGIIGGVMSVVKNKIKTKEFSVPETMMI